MPILVLESFKIIKYVYKCIVETKRNSLLKNRSVSKLHTPFTTLTERNFSRKTLPWLGSGISSGVGGQLFPCGIRRHMDFGVKAVGWCL